MKIVFQKEPLRVYSVLGAAYAMLWVFNDYLNFPETFLYRVWNNIWLVGYLTILNYILFEYVLPLFKLNLKKILIGLGSLGVLLIFYSFGVYFWRYLGIELHLYTPFRTHPSVWKGVEYHFPYVVGSILFFTVWKHIYDYRKLKEAAQKLTIEKQEAELSYLKSQTNPHFLFNTLNNIYALSREKSDLAPESILRLSKILRFMLYETNGAYIAVEQELKIISDFIALEQLRYDTSLRVSFRYDVEDLKQALPPLLLIPLVENAFKHGVSETRDQPFVDIHLSVNKGQLVFSVKNSAEATPEEREVREKIGLSNLRRQLELLYKDYSLSAQQGESQFTVTLKINLASHV